MESRVRDIKIYAVRVLVGFDDYLTDAQKQIMTVSVLAQYWLLVFSGELKEFLDF